MTAEIAVMNKEAVALAADSAVTVLFEGGAKVFPSANKIFALSKHEPVAAMVYGNAGLMGVPWEPAIKLFRRELGDHSYPSIKEYADEFLKFLRGHSQLFPAKYGDVYYGQHVAAYFGMLRSEIEGAATPPNAGPAGTPAAIPSAIHVQDAVARHRALWKKSAYLETATAADVPKVKRKYGPLISQVRNSIFAKIALTKTAMQGILELGIWCLLKCPPEITWPSSSGLVIAGFGSNEFFPALRAYSVQGIFSGHLHCRLDRELGIGFDNPSLLVPFAQREMVHAFMEGVNPEYQEKIDQDMKVMLAQLPAMVIDNSPLLDDATKGALKAAFAAVAAKTLTLYRKGLKEFRNKTFSQEIVRLVSMLPKNELAHLAESMVSLTSMRRSFSTQMETVGGPIDVAVISKGDGLIWVKRKHYFKPELNPQFFVNYNRQSPP